MVVNKYGRTNHFDSPARVCLNGQLFSKYFFDYAKSVLREKHENKRAKPVLAYTHLNTAHTYSGNRVKNIDAFLAEFFQTLARDQKTLTMIFSDHGHRYAKFSDTAEGRIEQIDPIFFMVVPHGVAEVLGKSRMAALFENQRRICTTADIFTALMSPIDPVQTKSSPAVSGIFSVLPANRTCADLSLLPLVRCKCASNLGQRFVADNSNEHKWLAEFGLGHINNAIQEQYMKGER